MKEVVTLSNGTRVPILGLGTWQLREPEEVRQAVLSALENGYRHFDTAAAYENEQLLGEVLRESSVSRQELFITSKAWTREIRGGYDAVLKAFDDSARKLGGYLDLYLLHWPVGSADKEAWKALEKLCSERVAQAIGVSNYGPHHLDALLTSAEIVPMVNQVEFHPYLAQPELMAYCRKAGIVPEAWSPLMQGRAGEVAQIRAIAEAKGKTPAQIVLRWDLQHGVITIPKSSHPERIAQNAQIFDFELNEDEMAILDALDQKQRLGPDPDTCGF